MKRTTDEIADELLVMRSQDGDRSAWKRLVARWQPKLYAHARRLTGHPEGAADVTQESWLAIVKVLGRLEDPAKFRSWAYRIVSNKATDWVRKRQRERSALMIAAGDADDAVQPVADDDRMADLQRAIRALPRDQRNLLHMFYREGMSLAEIADACAIPLGTVKSRLHGIRQELKFILKGTSHERR